MRLPSRLAGKRERVRGRSGRSYPTVDLGLHRDPSNQRDGDSNPAQDEPEYPETFLVSHPSPLVRRISPPQPRYDG